MSEAEKNKSVAAKPKGDEGASSAAKGKSVVVIDADAEDVTNTEAANRESIIKEFLKDPDNRELARIAWMQSFGRDLKQVRDELAAAGKALGYKPKCKCQCQCEVSKGSLSK